MLLDILSIAFVVISLWLFLTIIVKKIFPYVFKDNAKLSEFVAFIGVLMFLYTISAILVMLFIPGVVNKILMLAFALSPFIIGKFSTFEKENLFSIIQLVCILASSIFVISVF